MKRAASSPRVILVHGSWADGSCWRRVISMLDRAGYESRAVQLPMSGFEADVSALDRLVSQSGDEAVILVGHSYGGAVISAIRRHNVAGLIYVAASAPDAGEKLASLMTMHPASAQVDMAADPAGYIWATDRASFQDAMFGDDREDAFLAFACQKPVHASIFEAELAAPSWRDLPARYLVARSDRLFSSQTQAFLAERMRAETSFHECGHMMPLLRPEAIVEAVIAMARSPETP